MAKKYVEYMYNHNADYMNYIKDCRKNILYMKEAGKETGNEHDNSSSRNIKSRGQSTGQTYGNYMGSD